MSYLAIISDLIIESGDGAQNKRKKEKIHFIQENNEMDPSRSPINRDKMP